MADPIAPWQIVRPTPHREKLLAAIANRKMQGDDVTLLREAVTAYEQWLADLGALDSTGRERVDQMVDILNRYKNTLEVELIQKRGSAFIKRQKGQLKLDNSVLEEFLPHLLRPEILDHIDQSSFVTGPQKAFMSLSFMPSSLSQLSGKPQVVIKSKDQDFTIATPVHFKFSTDSGFGRGSTATGQFALAVFATEIKLNLDKTMFQEAAGTAQRLKQGCPVAKYFVLAEYLDMTPEDTRLTEVDNVFLLRKAKRLPSNLRADIQAIEEQRANHPIDAEVIWSFTREIQSFINTAWYDPDEALRRGSFS